MKTNILNSILYLINNNLYNIENYHNLSPEQSLRYKNRVNNMGETLENIIKDSFLFNNRIDHNISMQEYITLQNHIFSYLGNQNNPPDLIIKGSDAIEIKKIQTKDANISLNSSFPKNYLYKNSPMITESCKNSEEEWIKKDICYIIGQIDKNNILQSIWFVYGNCYCANQDLYQQIKTEITSSINNMGIETSETKEIAKIKKVDPLGITDLRVRGMWSIKNPSKVFEYIITPTQNPNIKSLMTKEKYYSFDINTRDEIQQKCSIKEVSIQNPNNPAKLMEAILIEYEFKS